MAPEELFLVSGVSEWWIYVLNLAPFASILSYTVTVLTRVYPDPYWDTDPDPPSSRIRIHNTV